MQAESQSFHARAMKAPAWGHNRMGFDRTPHQAYEPFWVQAGYAGRIDVDLPIGRVSPPEHSWGGCIARIQPLGSITRRPCARRFAREGRISRPEVDASAVTLNAKIGVIAIPVRESSRATRVTIVAGRHWVDFSAPMLWRS